MCQPRQSEVDFSRYSRGCLQTTPWRLSGLASLEQQPSSRRPVCPLALSSPLNQQEFGCIASLSARVVKVC